MKCSCIHVPLPWTYKEPLPKVQLCSWTTNYCLGKAEVHLSNPRCLRVWHLELMFLQSSCLPAVELVMRTTNTGQTVSFFNYCSLRALITFRSIPSAILSGLLGLNLYIDQCRQRNFLVVAVRKCFFLFSLECLESFVESHVWTDFWSWTSILEHI